MRKTISYICVIASAFALSSLIYGEGSRVFSKEALKTYSNEKLLAMLSYNYLESTYIQPEDGYSGVGYMVAYELSQRKPINLLLTKFRASKDDWQIDKLAYALSFIKSDEIAAEFSKRLDNDLSEIGFTYVSYLADRCDRKALEILNANINEYPIYTSSRIGAIGIFGTCKYRPAINTLIGYLDMEPLNLADAAIESLDEIMGLKKKELHSAAEAKEYYLKMATQFK